MNIHESITEDRVIAAMRSNNSIGFCIACGEEEYGVEPDARGYPCESCGEDRVYGAEEILLMPDAYMCFLEL